MPHEDIHICIIAGEASGDILGSGLMRALKEFKQDKKIKFTGIGGPKMTEEGLDSLFPMEELSVMGVVEILPRIPKLLHRINQTAEHINDTKPDILVTIDSPDFSFRVAKKVHKSIKKDTAMVHYVSPTVWAWRPERAEKVASLYDSLLCLFPFEPKYFDALDIDTLYTGHPMLEQLSTVQNNNDIRGKFNIDDQTIVLGLFFGSRMGELNRIGPVLHNAATKLASEVENLHIISPTLPYLKKQVQNLVEEIPCRADVITDQDMKWPLYRVMDLALATSGTIGLELAIAGVPHAIAYKMNLLTWIGVRNKITVKYAHLANIILDKGIIPEFIQKDCRAENIKEALLEIIKDPSAQKSAFEELRLLLSNNNGDSSSKIAADFLLSKQANQ
jgi:lipid-A-disaccharide synthase